MASRATNAAHMYNNAADMMLKDKHVPVYAIQSKIKLNLRILWGGNVVYRQ